MFKPVLSRKKSAREIKIVKYWSPKRNPISMKFLLESVTKEGCRSGLFREIGRHANLAMETPTCVAYTRAGAVPHLTWDLVEMIGHLPRTVQLTCATLVDHQEALSQFGRGMAEFAGLPYQGIVYISVQDPAHPSPSGYNDKKSVSVFTPAGRAKLDVNQFISLQEAMKPDWFEALSDGDTPPGCSLKRCKKAVDRTITLLDACLEAKNNSQKLGDADIMGVIEGGECLTERLRSARETTVRPVDGFVLDALTDRQVDPDTRLELLKEIGKELPDCKPRLLAGVGKPNDVLQAIESGIDLFDSSYPYEVTQRGCALTFPCEIPEASQTKAEEEISYLPQSKPSSVTADPENRESEEVDSRFELDLSDKRFAEDFSPVAAGCDCYCCRNHTKAYINHLLNVNELLARVLLMSHNNHHYFKFFHNIRSSIKQGTFCELKKTICSKSKR